MIVYEPGQTVLVRQFRHSNALLLAHARPGRVIFDDDRGLMLWTPAGSAVMTMKAAAGGAPRALSEQLATDWVLTRAQWRAPGLLVLIPPAGAHSVWWFFTETGAFHCWYVNLEEPAVRWAHGVDTSDHALDLLGFREATGNRWEWKDEDEFAERIGHHWYWDEAQAAEIRAEGLRAAAAIEAGVFPFDGSFCDFQPDPAWPPLTDLTGFDEPLAGVPGDERPVSKVTAGW